MIVDTTKYLAFSLGVEEFGIPLLTAKEVIALPEITPTPHSPPHFLGIINLRGLVISIIDLRIKIGLKPKNSEETSVIIVDFGDSFLGVVVDSVNSVISINKQDLLPPPNIESTKNSDYIVGVFRKQEHQLLLILDIFKILSREDKGHIQTKTKAA